MSSALVVLNYNDEVRCLRVITSSQQQNLFDYYILVDNHSSEESVRWIENNINESIIFIKADHNGGYGYGHNLGLRYACDILGVDLVFTANSDVIFNKDLIEKCKYYHKQIKEYGLISCRIKTPSGEEQLGAWHMPSYLQYILYCYKPLDKLKIANVKPYTQNDYIGPIISVDVVRGSFQAFKASAISAAGYFDEDNFLYNEENIIGCRLKNAGFSTGLITDTFYIHDHKKSSSAPKLKSLIMANNSGVYFMKKYGGINSLQILILIMSNYIQNCYSALTLMIKKFRLRGKN